MRLKLLPGPAGQVGGYLLGVRHGRVTKHFRKVKEFALLYRVLAVFPEVSVIEPVDNKEPVPA